MVAQFPNMGVEKEFAQAAGRSEATGLTDRQTLQSVLTDTANRYLVRQLCWVLMIEGLATYIVVPHDPADFELLVNAVRPDRGMDLDVIIGIRGPIAPPEACNGLMVPFVLFDQMYSFNREELIQAIPRPESIPQSREKQFRSTAAELLDRILQLADNAGATDEHRALNYLAVRYPAIYARTAVAHQNNASLSGVEARPSRLSGIQRIVDVIFSYTNRQTDVTEKYFVRVDVSTEWPFLVRKISPYFEH
jgi:hypothetical protein